METAQHTPRSRFSSTLGSMGTPARRAPGTPLSARRTFDRSSRGPSNFSYSTSNAIGTPKNIFRASMSGDRARQPYTPRATSSLRQAHSTAFPSSARSMRTSTGPSSSASALKAATSGTLFNQTIDDPPASLDGDALMNQIPEDPSRQGSVYADDFLAHTCPPGLDDLGRRQWFCILDLRRLKYAANELFAKKDWRINVANFAKEYEKSRGLIMLRYGLYEFQTVKPTDEQMKKWRKDHDIPEPEDEGTPVHRDQISSKRKAEDDLPLVASSVNAGKRRQTEPEEPLAKGKRRAVDDDEADENQPSKLHKMGTPSHSLSAFMKAAAGTTTPQSSLPQPKSSGLFGDQASTTESTKSVFGDPKDTNAPSPNIFEHVSEASRAPSLNNGDAGGNSDAESVAEDSEGKDASGSSGGIGTPAEGREGTPSLFDRVTKDKNGQPVRAFGGTSNSEKPKTSPFVAGNQTWTTSTPIKFSGVTSNPFGSKPTDDNPEEPAPFKPMFTAKQPEESKSKSSAINGVTPAVASAAEPPAVSSTPETEHIKSKPGASADSTSVPDTSSLLKSFSKPTESTKAAKPTTSNMFASASVSQASANIFGSTAKATGAKPVETPAPSANGSVMGSSTLFGSNSSASAEKSKTSLLGSAPSDATENSKASLFSLQPSESSERSKTTPFSGFGASSSVAKPTTSVFGIDASATPASDAPKTIFGTAAPPTNLFGATPAVEDKTKSVFGATPITEEKAKSPLFGSATEPSEPPSSKNTFGGFPVDEPLKANPIDSAAPVRDSPKTSLFGGASQSTSSGLFGSATAVPLTPAFGTSAPATDTKSAFSFGSDAVKPATASGNDFAFGSSTTPSLGGEKNPEGVQLSGLFGTAPAATTQPTNSIFGASSNGIFSSSQNTTPATSFNFPSSETGGNPFTANNAPAAPSTNVSFSFGAGTSDSNSGSGPFVFGNASAAAPAAVPTPTGGFSFGSSAPGTPPATTGAPSFSFTGATPSANTSNLFAPQPAGLAAPGGTSTGTSSPLNLGGASSLATTPAATTPEPTTVTDEVSKGTDAAKPTGDENGEEKQAQISLTEGGPGEEDEEILHEVKCKALKEELELPDDFQSDKDRKEQKSKSAWSTKGVGPLRILRHKTTGVVRLVLRAEPRGNIVVNSVPIACMPYTAKGKYCVAPFPSEKGGLDKWMLMVKTPDAAKALADAINKYNKVEKPE